MAKIQTGISINESIAEEAKKIAKGYRWDNFSKIVEMGLELFIEKYGQMQPPGLITPTQEGTYPVHATATDSQSQQAATRELPLHTDSQELTAGGGDRASRHPAGDGHSVSLTATDSQGQQTDTRELPILVDPQELPNAT